MALTAASNPTDAGGRVIRYPGRYMADDLAPEAIAQQLHRGEIEVWHVTIGGAFGLERSKAEPCVLCGYAFHDGQWARAFWPAFRRALGLVHESCFAYASEHGEVKPEHACVNDADPFQSHPCRACDESLPL